MLISQAQVIPQLRDIIWHLIWRKGDLIDSICDIKIGEITGSGAQGTIFNIIESGPVGSGTTEVLKVYADSQTFDDFRSFYVECDITSRLLHPNLMSNNGFLTPIGSVGFGDSTRGKIPDCKTYGLKMPLAVSTFKYRAELPFIEYSLTDRIRDAYSLFSALEFLHRNSVVHYDLKDSNIVVTGSPDYAMKIIDFGSAQYISEKDAFEPGYSNYYYTTLEFDGKLHGRASDVLVMGINCLGLIAGDPGIMNKPKEFSSKYLNEPARLALIHSKLEKLRIDTTLYKSIADFFNSILVPHNVRATASKLLKQPLFKDFKSIEGKVNTVRLGRLLNVDYDTKIAIKEPSRSDERYKTFSLLTQQLYSQLSEIDAKTMGFDVSDPQKFAASLRLTGLLLDVEVEITSSSQEIIKNYNKPLSLLQIFNRLLIINRGTIIGDIFN